MQVPKRDKHLIPTHAKKRLYLACFLPCLTYCSTVWFHCGKRSADISEKLNESIHRFVFNDFNNSYEKLLQEINQLSLRERRINDMLILVFLAFNNAAPGYNNNNNFYLYCKNRSAEFKYKDSWYKDKIFKISVSNKKNIKN